MKRFMMGLVLTMAPVILLLSTLAALPDLCLILFLIFPPLVLICLLPVAGLLPLDFQTFL